VAVQVVLGPDAYLFGEETGLEEVIEGKQPLPRQLAPYILGLFAPPGDNPTAMNNVETLALATHVVADGADWLRQWGTDASPGTMCFTLTGDVQREGVYELPLGTSMRELVEDRGGGPPGGRAVKAIFPGASSTILTREQLDTPLDFESMRAVGSGLGAGGFAVYDESACVVHLTHLFSRFLSIESCGQCPACKLNSGEITERLAKLDRGEGGPADVETILARALKVTDGQKCALPTGETLIVQSALQLFPEEFRAHTEGPCPNRHDLRLPKLVDWDEATGRFAYDERYDRKRPDWTYAA
jgi:NADH:ubiquinone oxidoreductase subunit F (NADH-binding)